MRPLPAELAHLPTPEIIEELAYEELRSAALLRLQAEFDAEGIAYVVGALEANPAGIQMRESAYKELNLRQRINEAMRAMLLAYAEGSDLDHYVAHKTTRMAGETDQRLATRYLLLMQGSSTGGTTERYEAEAMAADIKVSQAFCYTIGKSPIVYLAITSTAAGGVADQMLVDNVQTRLDQRAVRLVNDKIVVVAAVRQIVDIDAKVWISERASTLVVDSLPTILSDAWTKRQAIGLDLTRTFLLSALAAEGVHRVELVSPAQDVIADKHEAIAIGNVNVQFMGKEY